MDLIKRYAPWFQNSYFLDWLLVILLIMVSGAISYWIPPHQRLIVAGDASVTYPLEADIISPLLLVLIVIVIPLLFFAGIQLFLRSAHDFHNATLGLLTSFAVTLFFTGFYKLYCGRPRPDHFGMLNVDPNSSDAWMSFPSGHSSSSFSSMTFLSLYVCGKLGTYARASGHVWKYLISAAPQFLACFVAASRTRDFHHFYADVVAGSLIGIVVASSCYLLFYPLPWDGCSHLPKSRAETGTGPETTALMHTQEPGDHSTQV